MKLTDLLVLNTLESQSLQYDMYFKLLSGVTGPILS